MSKICPINIQKRRKPAHGPACCAPQSQAKAVFCPYFDRPCVSVQAYKNGKQQHTKGVDFSYGFGTKRNLQKNTQIPARNKKEQNSSQPKTTYNFPIKKNCKEIFNRNEHHSNQHKFTILSTNQHRILLKTHNITTQSS